MYRSAGTTMDSNEQQDRRSERERIEERGGTYRGERRGRAWYGKHQRVSREVKLKHQRARQRRYQANLAARREPDNATIASALLAVYAVRTGRYRAGATLEDLDKALVKALAAAGFNPRAAGRRIRRIRWNILCSHD